MKNCFFHKFVVHKFVEFLFQSPKFLSFPQLAHFSKKSIQAADESVAVYPVELGHGGF